MEGGVPWGQTEELLAILTEEVALLASDRRRKEPLTVNRPYEPVAEVPAAAPTPGGMLGVFAGLSQMGDLHVGVDGAAGGSDG
jgi:hypothetical protein